MGFASWQRYCTASSSERQPNFAALNRGRHLCSAGRPSCWALAHILVAGSFEYYELLLDETISVLYEKNLPSLASKRSSSPFTFSICCSHERGVVVIQLSVVVVVSAVVVSAVVVWAAVVWAKGHLGQKQPAGAAVVSGIFVVGHPAQTQDDLIVVVVLGAIVVMVFVVGLVVLAADDVVILSLELVAGIVV